MLYLVKDPDYRSFRYRSLMEYGFKPVGITLREFPDGEIYVRFLDDIDSRGVYLVVVRGFPEQDRNILKAILITSTLRELGARKILLFMPYLPYSRQDKRFLEGEAVSAKIVAKLLVDSGADRLITIDIHNPNAYSFLGNKFMNLSTTNLWSRFINRRFADSRVGVISPDIGRKHHVSKIAANCNANVISFMKIRDLHSGRILRQEPEDPNAYREFLGESSVIFIIDDILATGGTVSNIARRLRSDGFRGPIYALFTHGLFIGNAYDRLINAGVNDVFCTDTVENPFIHPDTCIESLVIDVLAQKSI